MCRDEESGLSTWLKEHLEEGKYYRSNGSGRLKKDLAKDQEVDFK